MSNLDPAIAKQAWAKIINYYQKPRTLGFKGYPVATVAIPARIFLYSAGHKGGGGGVADDYSPLGKWGQLTSSRGPASILYLSLVALAQVLYEENAPAQFTIRTSDDYPRQSLTDCLVSWQNRSSLNDSSFENASGFEIGLNLIFGCASRLRWTRSLSTAITRLRALDLAAPNLSNSKKFKSLTLWGGQDSDKILVESPIPYNEKGYNEPKAIPVPLTFFTNGWNIFLSGKETHAFLALIYQSMRQPTREAWFVAPNERKSFGLDDKSYQRATKVLVELKLIQPVDEKRYAHRAGRGAAHDKPHDFKINLEGLKSSPL